MNKIALILPYFGKLPNYFELFLYSCSINKEVDFLIFSNEYPDVTYENIKYNYMSFEELNQIANNKLGATISSPYKLCDFKPMYGKLFEDYLNKYDYWGYCDCDMIFGNLNLLLNQSTLQNNDKILTDGHLTIFKNQEKINNLYKNQCKGIISFKDLIKIKEPCFFDELMFPKICEETGIKTYKNKMIYADILPQNFDFMMPQNNLKSQRFVYKDGKILRINDNREYIYIHLQKRKMIVDENIDYKKPIYIYSNIFTNDKNYNEKYDKKYKIKYYINYFKRFNIRKIKIKLLTCKIKKGKKWIK